MSKHFITGATVIGNRKQSVAADQLFDGRDARSSVLRRIHRRNQLSIIEFRVGLLNAQSVHNKCANIQQWISSRKLNIVGLVETWHDDMSSPDLIACAPPGYKYIEKARARKDELSMSTNHGGVCLLYDATLHVRRVQLPDFTSFEVVCSTIHRAGFNAVVVVLYRPGSRAVTLSFFSDFTDLMERLATYSAALIVVGDFNIHVDDATNDDTIKLCDVLSTHDLQQHVNSSTHRQGHMLDLFITRSDQLVDMLPIDAPLLSDLCCVVNNINYM